MKKEGKISQVPPHQKKLPKKMGGPPPPPFLFCFEISELSEMARTLIEKSDFFFFFLSDNDVDDDIDDDDVDDDDDGNNFFLGGGIRVLACADMLARTPLGVRQYFQYNFSI